MALGHLDELQKAKKYPIKFHCKISTVSNPSVEAMLYVIQIHKADNIC